MDASNYKVCPDCDSVVKGEVCLKCGKVLDESLANVEGGEISLQEISPHKEVQSIFTDLIDKEDKIVPVVKRESKAKKLVPAVLAFILFLGLGLNFYKFIYTTPKYFSPLVLSTANGKKFASIDSENPEVLPATTLADNEKLVDIKPDLKEGNFESHNYLQFASSDIPLLVQVFDVKNIFNKFIDSKKYEGIKKDLDISDDDIDAYMSNDFAILYPQKDLKTWGASIFVKDEEFVTKKLDMFNKNKEKKDSKYKDYYAEIVSIIPKVEGVNESTPSAEELAKAKKAQDKYLLVSNSKEYLDQMKELSEGNIISLANDLKLATAKEDIAPVGLAYVYKSEDSSVWDLFAEYVGKKYDYVGLDKILSNIKSNGIGFYAKENKLKIISTKD